MGTTVTFVCECEQGVAQLTLQRRDKPSKKKRHQLLFRESGEKSVDLIAGGSYSLVCRALGTPDTDFSVKLTTGGKMNPIEDEFPVDGRIAANRVVGVDR